jgi:hypothetical protein
MGFVDLEAKSEYEYVKGYNSQRLKGEINSALLYH